MSSRGEVTALVLLAALAGCLAEPPPAAEQAGATADAGDATDDAAPGDGPVASQLLDNENFERGTDGWVIDGTAMIGDPDQLGVSFTAASGDGFAQVGREDNDVNGIVQLVTVPAWATALSLTGQRCFTTEDSDPTRDDLMSIFLRDSGGEVLETLFTVSNAEVGTVCNWTTFDLPVASSHAGEQIQLALIAETDATELTAFWFDDLHLVASTE